MLEPPDRLRQRLQAPGSHLSPPILLEEAVRLHPEVVDLNHGRDGCDQAEGLSRETNQHPRPDAIDHTGSPATKDGTSMDEFIVLEAAPSSAEIPTPGTFKGRSLGVFGPENNIRLRLSDLLVNPLAEPVILLLIIAQVVLLAVAAAPDVWGEGNARPDRWGKTPIDWALFAIFIIYTLETMARIIVSRLFRGPPKHRAVGRQCEDSRGIFVHKIRTLLLMDHSKASQPPQTEDYGPFAFARSFLPTQEPHVPKTMADEMRMNMARKAFLRHTFNRLDFASVVAFWISFILGLTRVEHRYHIYIFRMASCLRIFRLMALTSGTLSVLRALKKTLPLLIRIFFLIAFFWLVFAIVGVQSFKGSLSRQCVWLDPSQPTDLAASFTNPSGFCGGYLRNDTDSTPITLPWVFMTRPGDLTSLRNGTGSGKGHICPRGSICLQQERKPYNNTVHFDDIVHSLQLTFIVMSTSTFSDLMYYTMNSEAAPAALFFAATIIVLALWLINLFIAVFISSFQIIREESKLNLFTADEHDPTDVDNETELRRRSTLQRLFHKTAWIWILLITYDLFVMASKSTGMNKQRGQLIDISEIVTTILLDIEITIRWLADWRSFHRGYRNIIDLCLAIVTSVILIPPIHNSGQVYAWLTLFQILRIYRVVLAIPIIRNMIMMVWGKGLGNLAVFTFLATFLITILAAQLFRGEITKTDYQNNDIPVDFESTFNSFLGMYQLLSNEKWAAILYNVTAFTTAYSTSWIGAIFLFVWYIISRYVMINMFIAVFAEQFDISEDEKRLAQVKIFLQNQSERTPTGDLSLGGFFAAGRQSKHDGHAYLDVILKDAIVRDYLKELKGDKDEPILANPQLENPGFLSSTWGRLVRLTSSREPNPFHSSFTVPGASNSETLDARDLAQQAVASASARRKAQREYLVRHPTYNNALFIFRPGNPLRRLCQALVGPGSGGDRFQGNPPNTTAWYLLSLSIYIAIIAMIVVTCIAAPLYQKEYFSRHMFSISTWLVWTEVLFLVIFSLEALIKIVADGFFFAPNAYLRSSWATIDVLALLSLWLNVAFLFANGGTVPRAVGILKGLRAFRLLRFTDATLQIFRSHLVAGGLKRISAALVSLSLLLPFAIYGVNLFHSQMVSCNDKSGSVVRLEDCFGEYNSVPFPGPNNTWNLVAPRVASSRYFSFDNFGDSLFTLFQIITSGWVQVSVAAQSTTGAGMQPRFGASQGNAMFFVIFVFLARVFIIALLISILIRNRTEQTGVAFLTMEQRSWQKQREQLRQISPDIGWIDMEDQRKAWYRRRAIKRRGKWYRTITFVLVLQLILLIVDYAAEPDWWMKTKDYVSLAFTLLYMANIPIRINGLGWRRFRQSPWDVFASIAVPAGLALSIANLAMPDVDGLVHVQQVCMVIILCLLIPRNEMLEQLFRTASLSLLPAASLLWTWVVFFMGFAIAMTQGFGLTRLGGQYNGNYQNFRAVPNALILLFRMSFGEGWNRVMEDFASVAYPFCAGEDCGSPRWAYALFTMWNIISMFFFANLFLVVIYERSSYEYHWTSSVSQDEITGFKVAWRKVDPDGTGYIGKDDLVRILGELFGVFEMRIYDREDSVASILDDVRGGGNTAAPAALRSAVATQSAGIDLQKLNARLNRINIAEVRRRRMRHNLFYEEMMVSADPERGISFTDVLIGLAQYNIVSDSKSLRLEEFLRRRARLQHVEDILRRKTTLRFFDTLYWLRKFRRHLEMKRGERLASVPQFPAPEILVDEEESAEGSQESPPALSSRSDSPGLTHDDEVEPDRHGMSSSDQVYGSGGSPVRIASERKAHARTW